MGSVLGLAMDGRGPNQLAEDHAGGPLQVEPGGGPQADAAQIGVSPHEMFDGQIFEVSVLQPRHEGRPVIAQLPAVGVEYAVMMGEEQHLFAALQPPPYEGAHRRGFREARRLPLVLRDLLPQQRPGRPVGGAQGHQVTDFYGHLSHAGGINPLVGVDLLNHPALGRQLGQHVGLGAP